MIKKIKIPRHLKKVILAFLDQIVISLQNFLLSIFLIKNISIEDFGLYNLIIPITLFATSIQNALFNMPMMVNYLKKDNNERSLYISSQIVLQIYFLTFIILTIFVIISTLFFLSLFSFDNYLLVLSSMFAVVGLFSREFLRNYFFTIEIPQNALVNDFIFVVLQIFFLTFTFLASNVSLQIVLFFIGLSAFLSSAPKLIVFLSHNEITILKKHLVENWLFGKWIILGVIVTHIQSYGYIYLIGLFLTPKAIGLISAARLFFVPFQLLSVGYAKVAIPRGTRLFNENRLKQFLSEELGISFFFTFLIILYSIIIYLIPPETLSSLFSKEYVEARNYLMFFGLSALFSMFSRTSTNGLQVIKDFKILSKLNFFTMLISVISTLIMTKYWKIEGALIAMVFVSFFSSLLLWIIFYLRVKNLFVTNNED